MVYAEKLKFKQALYQFLIDHSRLQPDGYFRVLFYFKTPDELYKRIEARALGQFKRYDIEQKERSSEAVAKDFARLKWHDRRNEFMNQRIKEIESGNFWDRLLLFFYRKIRNKLFGKINKSIEEAPIIKK